MVNKKIIAKEWLFLISFLFFGLIILPMLSSLILTGTLNDIGLFYDPLVELGSTSRWYDDNGRFIYNPDFFNRWLFVLSPYILFNFIRSIIWAIKQIRNK